MVIIRDKCLKMSRKGGGGEVERLGCEKKEPPGRHPVVQCKESLPRFWKMSKLYSYK